MTSVQRGTLAPDNLKKPDMRNGSLPLSVADLLVNVSHEKRKVLLSIVMVRGLPNLTKPHIGNLSKPDIETTVMLTNVDIETARMMTNDDILTAFSCVREGERFSDVIKKGSTENAALCCNAEHGHALGSTPSFRSLSRQESLTHELKFPCPAASFICSKSKSSKRMCFMVLPLRSNDFFSFSSCIGSYQYYNGKTDGNYQLKVNQYQSVKTAIPGSAGTLTGHLTTTVIRGNSYGYQS